VDPGNVELLTYGAWRYTTLRQFPTALKLLDRVLDIMPNDQDVMAKKARIYQAQGNLQEAARYLLQINWQTPDEDAIGIKITQLRLERNYAEAVQLLQHRLGQFHYGSQWDKSVDQVELAFLEHLGGNTTGAKVTAEQARNSLEQSHREEPSDDWLALLSDTLSQAYATTGEKDLALEAAERAIKLHPRAKDPVSGPWFEENLALIQTTFGQSSRAISILTQLLQAPYNGGLYNPTPITAALLRLDRALGSLCAPILLFKSSARKSRNKDTNYTNAH